MSPRRQANSNSESVDNYLKAILSLGGPGASPCHQHSRSPTTSASRPPRSPTCCKSWPPPQRLWSSTNAIAASCSPSRARRRALEIVRHHRLIETFLYEVLDYPIEEVHEEAERLEHFISERFEERIAAKLGHPRIDPHGHSIPTMEGEMTEPELHPADRCACRQESSSSTASPTATRTPCGS